MEQTLSPPTSATTKPAGKTTAERAALRAALFIVMTLTGLAGGFFWLLQSPVASQPLAQLLNQFSQHRLLIKGVHGPLAGPLHIDQLRWQDNERTIELDGLQLSWSWQALLQRRLSIQKLRAKRLSLHRVASETPLEPPASLVLPVALELEELDIGELRVQQQLLATHLTASLSSDRKQHRLTAFHARRQQLMLTGAARLAATAPFPLQGEFILQNQAAAPKTHERPPHSPLAPPTSLALSLTGSLEQLALELYSPPLPPQPLSSSAQGSAVSGAGDVGIDSTRSLNQANAGRHAKTGLYATGHAHLELRPFASPLLTRAQVQLQQIDLGAWIKDAPATRMDIDADLQLQPPPADAAQPEHGLSGPIEIRNHDAAAYDKNRLPLSRLRAQLHWQTRQTQHVRLTALELELPGQAQLTGTAYWEYTRLQLDLQARHLDLQALHSRLQTTRLRGALHADISKQQQNLQLDLNQPLGRGQPDLRLQAQLFGNHEQLRIQPLTIRQGKAQLQLTGELQHAAAAEFKLSGQLQAFDPATLVRLAPGRLNARLELAGQLKPQLRLQAEFALQDSQWAAQALAGRGRLNLAWPRVPQIELQLQLAGNQLQLQGAWGGQNDHLDFQLAAPQLAALDRLTGAAHGITGTMAASGRLAGSMQEPRVQLKLASPYFNWPEHFSWRELHTELAAGTAANAALKLDLGVQELRPAGNTTPALSQLRINAAGQTDQHHAQLQTRLHRAAGPTDTAEAATADLGLELSGGWQAGPKRWQGELNRLQLQGPAAAHNFSLSASSQLELAQDHWQLGRTVLNFPRLDTRLELQAQASSQQLQAQLRLQGLALGSLEAQLTSGLSNPWTLDRQAPWSGNARIQIARLQSLMDFIDAEGPMPEQLQGQLTGRLRLSGRPAAPEIQGQLQGSQLGLQWPESGLRLEQGRLQAEFNGQRLRLQQLTFISPLQSPPRALQQAVGKELATLHKLSRSPGRLNIQGELQYALPVAAADEAAPSGWLDVELDRLGIGQRSDQWLLVSGHSRLEWQGQALQLRGQLKTDTGYWQLSGTGVPRLSDDVIIHRTHEPAGRAPDQASRRWPLNLALTLDLGDKAYFSGFGLKSRLSGQLDIEAQGSDLPRATGTIRSVDGRYTAYGQKLDIERGILRFDGLLENPGLDIRAVRHGLDVEAGVQISGNVHQPRIQLISSPERPDSEKLAWLILGHGPEQLGAADATTLLSAASELLGNDKGRLLRQLRNSFGLDDIDIRQGRLDGSDRSPTSQIASLGNSSHAQGEQQILSLSKRLSSKLLISYDQALGQAASLVKLTLELGRHLALIGRAGSDNALDLLYTLQWGQSPASSIQATTARQPASSSPTKTP